VSLYIIRQDGQQRTQRQQYALLLARVLIAHFTDIHS
jgi:hypothetical protein